MDRSVFIRSRRIYCLSAFLGVLIGICIVVCSCTIVRRGGGIVLVTICDVIGFQSRDETGGGWWFSFPQYDTGYVGMRAGETVLEVSINKENTKRLVECVEFYHTTR